MLRYAITDGSYKPGDGNRMVASGVHFVQLRDKTLGASALLSLARLILRDLGESSTMLLINGRADVAIAAGASGVHLPANEDQLTVKQVWKVFAHAGVEKPTVSVSCHTMDEALRARDQGADLILFAPVFEKQVHDKTVVGGVGLDELRRICIAATPVKVLALGGVTEETAGLCVECGAAGVAGIRMFR